MKTKCPDDKEIERTKRIITRFNIKNEEELTQLYFKSDVSLLTCNFEKFIKISVNDFWIIPLYCVSLSGYTWKCGLKYTGIKLQTLQIKDMILLLEKNIRGGISSVMGDRYEEFQMTIKKQEMQMLYGHSLSQLLTYDENNFDKNVKLEEISNTPVDSDVGFFCRNCCKISW